MSVMIGLWLEISDPFVQPHHKKSKMVATAKQSLTWDPFENFL